MIAHLRNFTHLLYRTYLNWSADHGSTLAASVAYYTALAFFPLLLILLSTFGVFLHVSESGPAAEEQILDAIGDQFSPNLQTQVAKALEQLQEQASLGGPVGIVALLVVVIALFSQIDLAFNRIWKLHEQDRGIWGTVVDIVFVRIKAFLMLLGLLCVLLVIFASGIMLTATSELITTAPWMIWAAQLAVSWVLNTGVFTVLYYAIPNTKVPWSAALKGGIFASLIWEIGRLVLASYVIGDRFDSAYGVIGAFIAIMLWAYYAAVVLFFGAEFVHTISAGERK
ncbi:MAG: YihY/virulence factor BrkB family protein [Bythopirellula sp.]|nr:YihY/virulence factor BrkB family protein [Bythopirellula sp.]